MTSSELIRNLEDALREATRRFDEAARRLRGKHRGGEWEECRAAFDEKLDAERALGRALSEEVAISIEWTPRWSGGAPLPHVVANGHRTYLLYLVADADPNWDGTSARVVDPAALRRETLALVTFERCYAHTFGGPNDEVFDGHRLTGRGLAGYGAYIVENSRWLESEKRINSVHSQFDPSSWDGYNHYLLAFHDQMFECIAVGWRVELLETTFDESLQRIARLVLQH